MTEELARRCEEVAVYPRVVKCRGGWFAIWRVGDVGSGPWRTEEAAKAAMKHAYAEANQLDRAAYSRNSPTFLTYRA